MKSISEIDVNNNQLTALPPDIEGIENLTLFSFQNNDIELQSEENVHINYMIDRMLRRGVICLPRIYQADLPPEATTSSDGSE